MKKTIFGILLLSIFLISGTTVKKTSTIKSIELKSYSFNQLDSLQALKNKKVVVFVHTEWCKYCLMMMQHTFSNRDIVQKLNEDFYFVSLDAESKKDITYQGRIFKYKKTGSNTGIHQLAEQLAKINGQINYPSICLIEKKNQLSFQNGGYMGPEALLAVLNTIE